jgi:hypothetical protein
MQSWFDVVNLKVLPRRSPEDNRSAESLSHFFTD